MGFDGRQLTKLQSNKLQVQANLRADCIKNAFEVIGATAAAVDLSHKIEPVQHPQKCELNSLRVTMSITLIVSQLRVDIL